MNTSSHSLSHSPSRLCPGVLIFTVLIGVHVTDGAIRGNRISHYAKNPGFTWHAASTTNFTIYFEAGTRAEREIAALQNKFERSLKNVETLLDATPYSRRIHVFVLESSERLPKSLDKTLPKSKTNGTRN